MPCVFCVDLTQQDQFLLVRFDNPVLSINRGARDTRQFALSGQRQQAFDVYPVSSVSYRLIPAFFLSQSNSIFNRPISE